MPLLKQHLESKTIFGLLVILAAACGMALLGKLTAELVDVLKYVGGSFMLVRGVANGMENLPSRKAPDANN